MGVDIRKRDDTVYLVEWECRFCLTLGGAGSGDKGGKHERRKGSCSFSSFSLMREKKKLKRNHPRCVEILKCFRAPTLLDGSSTTH